MLGFGVALEERTALKKIFRVNPQSTHHDEVCHDYGVIFVMMGVIIEVFAMLVIIPNEVLDSKDIEWGLIQFAAVTASIGVILQIRFLFTLWSQKAPLAKITRGAKR